MFESGQKLTPVHEAFRKMTNGVTPEYKVEKKFKRALFVLGHNHYPLHDKKEVINSKDSLSIYSKTSVKAARH